MAQDAPLYKNLPAGDMLHLARSLNRRFDQRYAKARLAELGIPLERKAGKLSGGQQAQLALTVALARRPDLLVLDEPLAMLDPLARHDFMASVMAAVAEDGVSVVLSSHVLAELERVADSSCCRRGRAEVQAAGRRPARPAPGADRGQPPKLGQAGRAASERGARPAGRGREATCCVVGRTGRPTRCQAGTRIRSAWKNLAWPTCASPAPHRCPARPAAGLRRLNLANRRR